MSINTTQSYDALIKASESLIKEVREIHTKSSAAGLSGQDQQLLKERINQSRDRINAHAKQIEGAMLAIPNQKNYSTKDFHEVLGFSQFATGSLQIKEANLILLNLAERNIEHYKN